MKRFLAVLVAITFAASPAAAKTIFYKYEGPVQTRTGEGGIKQTNRGIDVWVQGSPPRRFEILGTIVDGRSTGDGNALTSKKVAQTVKEAGGDALLVNDQSSQAIGVISGGTGAYSWAAPYGQDTTTLTVIRYLPTPQ